MTLKNKINGCLIIFTLLGVCLIVFLIHPLFSGIKKSSQDLLSQRQTLVSFEAKVESLERFKTLYLEIKPDLEKISTLLVNLEVPVEFISFLEETSQDCQVLMEISPTSAARTKKDPWPSLAFQINSMSSFPKFLKFLEKLETSPYLIKIQNLNINKLGETGLPVETQWLISMGDVRANLLIKVFSK